MTGEELFNSDENKVLISICARKLISKIGIGGIVWGIINILLGIAYIEASILNGVLLILGIIMLGTGIKALMRPTLGVLLTETIVAIGLFLWNLAVSIINYRVNGVFEVQYLVAPLIFAAVFANYYWRLGHLRREIALIEPDKIKGARLACKALLRKKLKNEPSVIQTKNQRCRAQLMEEKAFFIQRKLTRAFVASKESIRDAVIQPDAKRLKLCFKHPLGKLKYQFDKKNSEKLNNWLAVGAGEETESTPASV